MSFPTHPPHPQILRLAEAFGWREKENTIRDLNFSLIAHIITYYNYHKNEGGGCGDEGWGSGWEGCDEL